MCVCLCVCVWRVKNWVSECGVGLQKKTKKQKEKHSLGVQEPHITQSHHKKKEEGSSTTLCHRRVH